MKPPENLQDLQSFLGLVNCLNCFSPALADLTAPLRAFCEKDTPFTWESSQQATFEAIKKEITIAPVLPYFDRSKTSTIQSDASEKGLGAVILQDDKPVIYASRTLTETEQCYSNIERELLGVVFLLLKDFITMCMDTQQWCKQITSHWSACADTLYRVSPHPTPKEGEDNEDFILVHMLTEEIPHQFYENWRFQMCNCRRHYFQLTDASGS